MRLKYGFSSMIVGLILIMAIGVTAQTSTATCPTLVQQSFTATEFSCESVPDGQACLGNGVVTATSLDGASVQFSNPGDLTTLASINRLAAQTINTESQAFTSIVAKLNASAPNGDPQVVDMLIFGDTVISNALEQSTAQSSGGIFAGTIEAGGGVIVRQDATADSNNIWQLLNGESVQAIGRSSDNQWVRILIPSPNGGAGWVFGQFVSIEGGREILPFQTNSSAVPESSTTQTEDVSLKSMQAFRMESLLTDPSCAETPDSGVMLQSPTLDTRALVEVNGVELRVRGTVFITAQVASKMTIYNLEGETAVIIDGNRVDMATATMVEVPLDASLAPTGAASDATPYSQEVADLLIFLPIRLLSRNFEISTTDATAIADAGNAETADTSTDTSEPSEQAAPPPPAATEVPVEEVNGDECPTLIQESYTATEQLCDTNMANTACVGNVGLDTVTAIARDGVENFQFASNNDKVNTTDIDKLSTHVFDDPANVWSTVVMTLDAKTTTGGTAQAVILVLGEVELENKGEDAPAVEAVESTTDVAPPTAVPATDTTEATETDTTSSGSGVPATIQSPGGIIVRPEPRVDSSTVGQLADGDAVIALGRSLDQQWVQVESETGISGWVFIQFVSVDGGEETLPIIDPNAQTSTDTAAAPATDQQSAPPPAVNTTVESGDVPEFTSMQSFDFSSTEVPKSCADTHNSGLLIQSPDNMDGNLILEINGIRFEINGTIFLTAELNENTDVHGLEGETIITAQDTSQTVAAGQKANIQMKDGLEPDSVPSIPGDYSYENSQQFIVLPLRLLPRNFDLIIPPAPADGGEVVESDSNETEEQSTDTSTGGKLVQVGGTTVDFDAECVISAGDRARNLRAGAGSGFDVINTLQPGQTIEAKTQLRGTDSVYWYETSKGWIRSDAGIPSADCENLPLYGVIYDINGSLASVDAVAPIVPTTEQPTATPVPAVVSDGYGDVCSIPGFSVAEELRASGQTYVEFGGVWTGQAGRAVTFSAEVPYYRPELKNILTFVNEDGSEWLGSIDGTSFTINFDSTRRFRVRVGALLGDYVTLRVSC